ncbi:MAG TPA: ABC transporter permease [Halococcus sp.]|nr:ABC transporter permease [Halococcus sp.]
MSETTTEAEDVPFTERISDNPRPALRWAVGALILLVIEFGAFVQYLASLLASIFGFVPANIGIQSFFSGIEHWAAGLPTLLSRHVIPNQGYNPPGPGWESTFLGLEPKYAWLLRVVLVYAYAFIWLGWFWVGYRWFRAHYRYADWTPRDDMMGRLRGHRWGQFGFVIVFAFVVMAIFAPALGPYTIQENIYQPYSYETTYFEGGSTQSIPIGAANLQSSSQGNPQTNVGPWTYDDFGRFHPFGTITTGQDLFTFIVHGARVSLMIGVVSIAIAGVVGVVFAMLTSYYKGLADLAVVIAGDSVQSLPLLLILILMSAVFSSTWIAELYDGAALLIGIFAFIYWPYMWRAVRGPSLQVAGEEWIDAAKSFGQRPRTIMRKHMFPYIIGYLLVYASLTIGGIIIATAALSFLGLGINPPTPEWGRIVSAGQPYLASVSWHISVIPGVLITLIVIGFNALGDGIRDAVDPQSATGEGDTESGTAAAAAGGGGG